MTAEPPTADDLGFSLIPPDDAGSTPEDDLTAAAQSALDQGDVLTPVADDPPLPFGRSWAFDFEAGRMVRQGSSPAEVRGLDALIQWIYMALHSARYAHAVFSDEFGIESPEDFYGEVLTEEQVSDYEQRVREALLVHDRITDVQDFVGDFDPTTATLTISDFVVVTDEELPIHIGGIQIGGAR